MASTLNRVAYNKNVPQLKSEAKIIDKTISGFYYNSRASSIVTNRFEDCNLLTGVSFPNVTIISDSAFKNCASLESIYFSSAAAVSTDAFSGCVNLHEIEFGSLTPIYAYFSTISNITSINFGAITTLPNSKSNAANGFFTKTKSTLQSIYFNGVEGSVPSYYWDGYSALTTAEFKGASGVVASYAFRSCFNLESISIPYMSGIYRNVFQDCSKLQYLDVPMADRFGIQACYRAGIVSVSAPLCIILGSGCFESCTSLSQAISPNVTTMSSSRHFANCTNLKLVSFEALTALAGTRSNNSNTVFLGATGIESIYFKSVTTVGSYYFASYSNLKYVNLPVVGVISTRAFQNDIALTQIELPRVQTINTYVFANCTSLSKAKFMWASRFNGNVFNGCTNLDTLYLLGSSMTILSGSTNNFTNTKITATTGSIYVPTSLLATYKANNSWKTYSNRFIAYDPPSYSTRIISQILSRPDLDSTWLFDTSTGTTGVIPVPFNSPVTVIDFSGGYYHLSVSTSSGIIECWAMPWDIIDWFPPGT